ncbi:MAG TPA: VOC family protein [Solirubrobacteraceae bacterium]|nr:VOC family protein [Solirubrobacteraceae bacterium]
MSDDIKKVGNVFQEVRDMERAVTFYRDVLRLPLKFQDGDRWAAFDAGGTTVALAAAEDPWGPLPGTTLSFKVDDVDEWAREAAERGMEVSGPEDGPHERKVTVTDPDGHRMVVYSALPQS